jgi:hypothetical protein
MRLSLTLAILLCLNFKAAAGTPIVKWDDRKDQPGKQVKFEEIKELKDKAKHTWQDCWAWAAFESFEPLMQPQKGSKPSGAKPLPFLKRVNLFYRGWQSGGDEWGLLAFGRIGEQNFEMIGWVPMRYLVLDNRAWQDNTSTLLQRAMIVTYAENDPKVEAPPMLLSLEEDPEKRKKGAVFRLFNIYFIYGDTNPADENDGFLLLGSKTQFNYSNALLSTGEDEPKKAIHGWVPKNRICRWKTREAMMWDPNQDRQDPVVTYKTSVEAKKILKGQIAKSVTSESIGTDKKPPIWPHRRMRYPVVPFKLNPNDKDSPEVLEWGAPGRNVLRQIGLVGNFVNAGGGLELEVAEIEQIKARLEVFQNEIDDVEILFVVDDTTSMAPWLKVTADTIENLILTVKDRKQIVKGEPAKEAIPQRRLKFAVTFVADVPPDQRKTPEMLLPAIDMTYGKLADAESAKAKEVLKLLRWRGDPANKAERKGWDPREQVFLGLRLGIEKAGFSPRARKLVIFVGDNGDHDTNDDGKFREEQKIVKLLTPKRESPIEFYALQVRPPKTPDEKALREQSEKIVELLRTAVAEPYKKLSGYFDIAKDERVFQKVILSRFDELNKMIEAEKEKMRLIGMGRFELIDELAPEFIEALGISKEKLEVLKKTKGAQIFSYAFVWEKNTKGQQQTRRQLLVSELELKELHKMLADHFASGDAVTNPTPQQIARMVANLQAGQDERSGESGCYAGIFKAPKFGDLRRVSVETVMKAKFGFAFQSPLLQMTVDDYENKPRKDRALLEADLKRRELLLGDVLAKKEYKYHKKNDADPFPLVRGELIADVDRAFFLHDDNKSVAWYWLDFDKEWP